MTETDLATMAGVSRTTVTRYETQPNKANPWLSFLSILGYWVGVVDWILVGQDGPEFYHILALKDQEVKYASIAEYTYLVIERRMTEKV